jgi:hypothetical protein
MILTSGLLPAHAKRLAAVALVAALYGVAQLPEPSPEERSAIAARFRFTPALLPTLPAPERAPRSVRAVHPSLRGISAWISAVGAAVALNDLDADGLPNDVCYVDVRTDDVVVAPVPGTGERFPPFALRAAPLPYDTATMAPMGCLPGDLNEDGAVDLLVYYWGRTPVIFLRRVPDAAAPPRAAGYAPRELVLGRERWYTNAMTLADLDGDGHADLVVGNYFPDGARILDARASGVEHMQHSMSLAYNGGRDRLLRWVGASAGTEPAVHFEDVRGVLGEDVALGWTLAVGASDLDGDLLPELYFANDFGPDRLLHNRSIPGRLRFALLHGERTLDAPKSKVLGSDSFKGMGVDYGDLNRDGRLDIYVSNIAQEYALEESHLAFVATGDVARMRRGVAPFVDRSEALGLARSGWGWDVRLDDFDNDGALEVLQATGFIRGSVNRWPELHELAMGNDELLSDVRAWPRFQPGDDLSGRRGLAFFARARDGRFYDVAAEVGLDAPRITRGIATADVDADGDLDFAAGGQWESSVFYRSEAAGSRGAGAFLGLRLRLPVRSGAAGGTTGAVRTRAAIGAEAVVVLPDGRRLIAQVDGGSGHSGKRAHDLHFGLGAIAPHDSVLVELRWRDERGVARRQTRHLRPGWHVVLLRGVPFNTHQRNSAEISHP